MRYKFYTNGVKIIAVSTYAKKTVKGIAKCNSIDSFDLEKGKALAKARCDSKVAHARTKNAFARYEQAQEELRLAQKHMKDMEEYYTTSYLDMRKCDDDLEEMLNNI